MANHVHILIQRLQLGSNTLVKVWDPLIEHNSTDKCTHTRTKMQ